MQKFSYDIKTETYSEPEWRLFTRDGREMDASSVTDGDEIRLRVDFKNVYEEEWKPCAIALVVYADGEITDVVTEKIRVFPFIPELYATTDYVKVNCGGKDITLKGYLWERLLLPDELENFLLYKKANKSYKELKADFTKLTAYTEYVIANPSPYFTGYDDARRFFDGTVCFALDSRYIYGKDRKYITESRPVYNDGRVWAAKSDVEKIFGCFDWAEEKQINGEIYLPVKASAEQMGYAASESYRGLVVIASKAYDISEENNAEYVKDMLRYILYERPSRERLRKIIKGRKHPYIVADKAKLDRMISEQTPEMRELSESILDQAKRLLNSPVAVELKGLPAPEGAEYNEVLKLYWGYRVTGERVYADKAIAHAMAMAGWPHWKVPYFLQTSFCMMTCGYVYDLFYDELTEQQKQKIREALIRMGIKPANEHYYGNGVSNWPLRPNNWNIVCNAGTIVGALAICNDYESELCFDTIEKAIASLEYAMLSYAPNGGWFEGSSYSGYTASYLALAIHAIESSFGTDFALADTPGFLNNGYFPFYMTGNDGKFNVHDDIPTSPLRSIASMWVAGRTKDCALRDLRIDQIKYHNNNVATFLDLVWCPSEGKAEPLALDMNFGYAEMATSRSSWDSEATWIGVHAGDNSVEHGQIDIGEFELESQGVKFAADMGRDDYALPDYFYFGSTRETYYVNRAEGHNVYVINPSEFPGQYHYASTTVKTEASNSDGVIYTIDMTPAYIEQLQYAKRGVMLHKNRRVFVVQDEIVPNNMDDQYYWFWHTDAEIEICGNVAKLQRKGKTLNVYFSSNVELEITKGITEPLPTTPPAKKDEMQMQMYGKKNKITVRFTSNADKVMFRATALPDYMEYDGNEIIDISDWKLSD